MGTRQQEPTIKNREHENNSQLPGARVSKDDINKMILRTIYYRNGLEGAYNATFLPEMILNGLLQEPGVKEDRTGFVIGKTRQEITRYINICCKEN